MYVAYLQMYVDTKKYIEHTYLTYLSTYLSIYLSSFNPVILHPFAVAVAAF